MESSKIENSKSMNKPYTIEWKNGDIFAYKLDSKYAKDKKINNKYLYFMKVNEATWNDIYTIPEVCFFNIISDKLLTLEEVSKKNFMPQSVTTEKEEMIVYYMINVIITSPNEISEDKLTYLGNYYECTIVYKHTKKIYVKWKELEKYIVDHYFNAMKLEKFEETDLFMFKTFMSCEEIESIDRLNLRHEYKYFCEVISQAISEQGKDLKIAIKGLSEKTKKRVMEQLKKENNRDDMIFYNLMEATYYVLKKYFNEDGTLK